MLFYKPTVQIRKWLFYHGDQTEELTVHHQEAEVLMCAQSLSSSGFFRQFGKLEPEDAIFQLQYQVLGDQNMVLGRT